MEKDQLEILTVIEALHPFPQSHQKISRTIAQPNTISQKSLYFFLPSFYPYEPFRAVRRSFTIWQVGYNIGHIEESLLCIWIGNFQALL